VADGGATGEARDGPAIMREVVADKAHMALGTECAALVVESDDPAGFLSAMLQGVEAEGGEDGCVLASEDAEHAALTTHPVFGAWAEIVIPIGKRGAGLDLVFGMVRIGQACLRGEVTGTYVRQWSVWPGPVKSSITPVRPPPIAPAAASSTG